jgi:hypothetical protein
LVRKIRVGTLHGRLRSLETAASLGVEINRCEEWGILKSLVQALKLLKACEQHMN